MFSIAGTPPLAGSYGKADCITLPLQLHKTYDMILPIFACLMRMWCMFLPCRATTVTCSLLHGPAFVTTGCKPQSCERHWFDRWLLMRYLNAKGRGLHWSPPRDSRTCSILATRPGLASLTWRSSFRMCSMKLLWRLMSRYAYNHVLCPKCSAEHLHLVQCVLKTVSLQNSCTCTAFLEKASCIA